ncbi:type VII toxin-antitoxin system HepT family RNase toxin [Salinigranum sp. GCM10025319]|uniref:type VII toxin-antitoxin system HepT family RNase toxin n=1 Tax=Salinigranum sp. GCM10025319 TaxID=3252687 RepID=UPI0036135303
MVDERVVSVKLEQIEQYHGELTEKRETLSRRELLSNTTEQRAVERMFENAIQACADLAQHVATREFGFDGTTSKDAIRVLHREGVIDEETADTLVAAIGFRNVLAHEYGRIDYEEVYETLRTGLGVYDTYSQQIARWVREHD